MSVVWQVGDIMYSPTSHFYRVITKIEDRKIFLYGISVSTGRKTPEISMPIEEGRIYTKLDESRKAEIL